MSALRYLSGVLLSIPMFMTNSTFAVTPEQTQSAEAVLNGFISDKLAPGLQYILVDEKQILFRYETGLADIVENIPVNKSTTFNGYSVTKTFVAAAVIKLVERGKIHLDDPIDRYVNNLPYKPTPTIRQLLQHTSGIPNPNPIKWIHKIEDHAQFDEQTFIRQVIDDNDELDHEPGEEFAYSNVGYMVLGQLVQAVSGKSLAAYVSDEIIKPLNLNTNDTISFVIENPLNHAHGYIRKWYWLNLLLGFFIDRDKFMEEARDGWVPFKLFMPNGKAYGGLVGNAGGFARYLQAMISKQAPFSQPMLDTLWETGRSNDGESLPVAMAWFRNELDGIVYFAHSGGAGGYYCEIRAYPEINIASVIMTNNTGISARHFLDQVDRFFLKDFVREK